jgi:hypothetical protein
MYIGLVHTGINSYVGFQAAKNNACHQSGPTRWLSFKKKPLPAGVFSVCFWAFNLLMHQLFVKS